MVENQLLSPGDRDEWVHAHSLEYSTPQPGNPTIAQSQLNMSQITNTSD